MRFFRLATDTGFRDLSGSRLAGRWSRAKGECIYVKDHPGLCLLDSDLVEKEPALKIGGKRGIGILEVPDGSIRKFEEEELPFGWQLVPEYSSRDFGSALLEAAEVLILGFPSVTLEREWDYLVNLRHPLAREVKVTDFYYPFRTGE